MTGFLVRHSRWFLFLSVFAGLVLPDLAQALRPLLPPSVAVLLILAMLRMDWAAVMGTFRRPGRVVLVLAWVLVGAPVVMAVAVSTLGVPSGLSAALILMGGVGADHVLSGAGDAIGAGGIAGACRGGGGNAAYTFVRALRGRFSRASAVGYCGVGTDVAVGRLVAVSVGGAILIRRLLGRSRLERHGQVVDAGSVVFLVLFAIAIMDGVTAELLAHPGRTVLIILGSFAANLGLQVFGATLFWWLGRRSALTVGLVSGNCNMALLLAVLPSSVHPDVPLYFALGQFPIYILPAVLTPVYRWLTPASA